MGTTLLGVPYCRCSDEHHHLVHRLLDLLVYRVHPIAGIMLVHSYTALQPVRHDALSPSAIESSKSNSQAIMAWIASLAVALVEMQTAITMSGVMSIDLLAFSAAFYYALRRLV